MPRMTRQELEEFTARPLVVTVTTLRENGSPQVTPVWYEYDNGAFYCWIGAGTAKVRDLSRDSRVSLCIATHEEPYKYVVAEGSCEIVSRGVVERSISIATRYYGPDRGPAYAGEMAKTGESVLMVLRPTRLLTESAA